MKKIILFIFACILANQAYAGVIPDGIYKLERTGGWRLGYIDVSNDTMRFIVDQSKWDVSIFWTDTLANCTIKPVKEGVVEISSVETPERRLENHYMTTSLYRDSTLADSFFKLVVYPPKLFQSKVDAYFRIYNSKGLSIDEVTVSPSPDLTPITRILQQPIEEVVLFLFDTDIRDNTSFFDHCCSGAKSIEQEMLPKELGGNNVLEVHLEHFNNGFFEEFVIQGEYMLVEDDVLIWHNERFVRCADLKKNRGAKNEKLRK